MRIEDVALLLAVATGAAVGCSDDLSDTSRGPAVVPQPTDQPEVVVSPPWDQRVLAHNARLLDEGRQAFRFDTFGSEAFWGDALRLHEAIAGEALGGVGPGLTPTAALSLGLQVDAAALPDELITDLQQGRVDLDDPATTLALLSLDAVVGIDGTFGADGALLSVGIQCALCHSVVDDSTAPGIGRRLDGWANRGLDVGTIIAFSPTVQPFADLLGVSEETVRQVLLSWGPGKFDASLLLDGKTENPFTGGSAAVLIPPAYGLAGVNLHTWTGWGGVSHWNALVANLEMQGQGSFTDARLDDPDQFPIAAREGFGHVRSEVDRVTPKLPALHLYQISLPAPEPPARSFVAAAAARGAVAFERSCASCHVPPLYTDPGWNLHTPEEIGIDSFQADRAPDHRYRTAPLRGLWAHQKGGFYHDGRFPTLGAVVDHYDDVLDLGLTVQEKQDLVQYLLSL